MNDERAPMSPEYAANAIMHSAGEFGLCDANDDFIKSACARMTTNKFSARLAKFDALIVSAVTGAETGGIRNNRLW